MGRPPDWPGVGPVCRYRILNQALGVWSLERERDCHGASQLAWIDEQVGNDCIIICFDALSAGSILIRLALTQRGQIVPEVVLHCGCSGNRRSLKFPVISLVLPILILLGESQSFLPGFVSWKSIFHSRGPKKNHIKENPCGQPCDCLPLLVCGEVILNLMVWGPLAKWIS